MSAEESLDARIRRKAHEIWEREGRPQGRDQEHWEMAAELIAQHDRTRETLRPNPSHGPDDQARRTQPVEPAFTAENQGEVPGLTDQGEEGPYAPSHRHERDAAERRPSRKKV